MSLLSDQTAAKNHDAPATPPVEFRLFRKGVNKSEKGDFIFDAKAAKSVMEKAVSWGNRYPFDYGHMMLSVHSAPDPAEAGKAAGWFTPELRDDELWATEITWTPKAHNYLANREYTYMSPAFNVDKDERVMELLNVSLTNLPAMWDLTQLVAADTVTPNTETRPSVEGSKPQMDARELSKAMSKAKMKDEVHAMHEKLHGKMHDEVSRAHLDMKMDEMSMDELKSYHAKLMKHLEPDGDEGAGEREHASGVESKEDKKHDKLPEAAPEAGASFAVVLSRIAELEKELAASKAEKLADSRQVILSQGVREGKLSPAEAKGEGARGKFIASLSLAQLNDYLAACEPLVNRTETAPAQSGAPIVSGSSVTLSLEGETKVVTLSDEERKIAKLMGNSTDSLAKTKARLGV